MTKDRDTHQYPEYQYEVTPEGDGSQLYIVISSDSYWQHGNTEQAGLHIDYSNQ